MGWLKDENRKREEAHQQQNRTEEWAARLDESGIRTRIDRLIAELNPLIATQLRQETDAGDPWIEVTENLDGRKFELHPSPEGIRLDFHFSHPTKADPPSQHIEPESVTDEAILKWLRTIVEG